LAVSEKLCLIDGKVAFMGGLDMCKSSCFPRAKLYADFRRLREIRHQQYVYMVWKKGRTNKVGHPIADAHPGNIDDLIFPGQDYNNARISDFEDVDKWENNKRECRRRLGI
jgi:phospholipase D1/2